MYRWESQVVRIDYGLALGWPGIDERVADNCGRVLERTRRSHLLISSVCPAPLLQRPREAHRCPLRFHLYWTYVLCIANHHGRGGWSPQWILQNRLVTLHGSSRQLGSPLVWRVCRISRCCNPYYETLVRIHKFLSHIPYREGNRSRWVWSPLSFLLAGAPVARHQDGYKILWFWHKNNKIHRRISTIICSETRNRPHYMTS